MSQKNKPATPEPAADVSQDASAAPEEMAALTAQAEAEAPETPADPNAPPPPPDVPTGEVLLMLYRPLAAIVAPNWKLQDSECKALADAHAMVIDKYFPDGLGAMGPEISAVLVTVAILGVRFNKPLREPEKKAAADATAAQ